MCHILRHCHYQFHLIAITIFNAIVIAIAILIIDALDTTITITITTAAVILPELPPSSLWP